MRRLSDAVKADDVAEAESAVESLVSGRLSGIRYAFIVCLIDASPNVCRSMFHMLDSATREEIKGQALYWTMESRDPLAMMRLVEELYGDAHVEWWKLLAITRDRLSPEDLSLGCRAAVLWLAARFRELHPEPFETELVDAEVGKFEEWLASR